MSHRGVEIALGRLATDEGLRRRFQESRGEALRELVGLGVELSPVELLALQTLDLEAVRRFAHSLDPRLQKASIDGTPEAADARADRDVRDSQSPQGGEKWI